MKINQITSYQTNFKSTKHITLPYSVSSQSSSVIRIVKELTQNFEKLQTNTSHIKLKSVLGLLKQSGHVHTIFQDGLSFILNDKKIQLNTSGFNELNISTESIGKEKNPKSIKIANNFIQNSKGFKTPEQEIPQFLATLFNEIDFPLLTCRKFFAGQDITSIISKLISKDTSSNKAFDTILRIQALYNEAQKELKNFVASSATITKIRNGYPNINRGTHRSMGFQFKNLGAQKNENYSINSVISRNGERYTVIQYDCEGEKQNIIVDKRNNFFRGMNIGRYYKLDEDCGCYTQKEINSPKFIQKLETLNTELENYKDYLHKNITQHYANRDKYSTNGMGEINQSAVTTLNKIQNLFDIYRNYLSKKKDIKSKNDFKQKYNINSTVGGLGIIFKDAVEKGDSIELNYRTKDGELFTGIIITTANGQKNSILIKDNHVIKHAITTKKLRLRKDVNTNFYSQSEIDKMDIPKYLTIIKSRLEAIEQGAKKKPSNTSV